MFYPFLTLDDNTEIVHSEMKQDNSVIVHIEKPDADKCFLVADCKLPGYEWSNIDGFSEKDIARFQKIIESTAHLILQFSSEGGFDHASGF